MKQKKIQGINLGHRSREDLSFWREAGKSELFGVRIFWKLPYEGDKRLHPLGGKEGAKGSLEEKGPGWRRSGLTGFSIMSQKADRAEKHHAHLEGRYSKMETGPKVKKTKNGQWKRLKCNSSSGRAPPKVFHLATAHGKEI